MKKIISVLLCAVMLFGILPLSIFAAEPADHYDLEAYGQKHFYAGLPVAAPDPNGTVEANEYAVCLGTYEAANDASDKSFMIIDGQGDTESFSIYASYDADYLYFATVLSNVEGSVPTVGRTILYLGSGDDIASADAVDINFKFGALSCTSTLIDLSKSGANIDGLTTTIEFAIKRSEITSKDKYFVRFYLAPYLGSTQRGSVNLGFEYSGTITVNGATVGGEARRRPHVLHLAVDEHSLSYYGQKIFSAPKAQNPVNVDGSIYEGEYTKMFSADLTSLSQITGSAWYTDSGKNIVMADSVGTGSEASFYTSYDNDYLYFAVTLENTAGNTHTGAGQLLFYIGDEDKMSTFESATIKYNNGSPSISSTVVTSYSVVADAELITYEFAVDRTKLNVRDDYFVRMALYTYNGATQAGSCTFGFFSYVLQDNGITSGANYRYPHVITLGDDVVAGGEVKEEEYTGGHNLVENGQSQFFVGAGTSATTVDGKILDGEYPVTLGTANIANNEVDNPDFFVVGGADSLESMELYANHDEDYLYFAVRMKDLIPKSYDFFYFNIGARNATNSFLEIYMPFYGGGKSIEIWPFENGATGGRGANVVSTLLGESKMTFDMEYVTYEISIKRDALESYVGKTAIDKLYLTAYLNAIDDKTGARGPQVWFGFKSDVLVSGGIHAPQRSNYYSHVLFLGKKADYETFFTEDCGAEYVACTHTSAVARSTVSTLDYVHYGDDAHVEICTQCGEMTEPITHTYGDGVVTTAASDSATGTMTYTCSTCSLTKEETIAVVEGEHDYGTPLNYSATQHRYVCACGEEKLEDHTWNGGETVLEATATQSGVKLYTCTVCGATKQESISNTSISVDESGDTVVGVNGEFDVIAAPDTISVNVTWENPVFTYEVKYKWNDETFTDEIESSGWREDERLTLTVENRSNVAISAFYEWRPGVDGITGVFDGVDENSKTELTSAVGSASERGPVAVVTFSVTGGTINQTQNIGNVTVTIAVTESSGGESDTDAPTETPDTERFVYDHVLIIGLDGIGNFRLKTETPNIDAIFSDAAITDVAKTSLPSSTAPCWSSMFTGVTPAVMGVSTNPDASTPDVNATYTAVQENFPSIFSQTRAKYPEASIVSISAWNQMNDYVIGNNDGVVKINTDGSDYAVRDKALEYINGDMPELMFLHFDSADALGHQNGYESNIYLSAITGLDAFVGDIYSALEANGLLENTLIILATDHGGTGKSHGGDSDAEMVITLGFKGKSVLPIKQFDMTIRDIALVISHALDLDPSETWDSNDVSIPEYMFSDGIESKK